MAVRQRPGRGAPGQHFLRSSRLAADLVRDAGTAPGDLVVDVGAGSGVLTRALVDAGARVIALELDAALAATLRKRFERGRVTVIEADALEWNWPDEAFSVVANLPFAGSGAILARLLSDPERGLRRADVIVEWGFAAKQVAVWPATLKGTYWRTWYDVAVTRRLSRTAFAPAPRVDAAVLRFTRGDQPRVPVGDHARYWDFLRSAFRAQTPISSSLRPRLSPVEVRRLAATLGFAADARAIDLDAGQWAGLYAFARARRRL